MNWVNRRQSMNIASLWTWVCTCLVVPSLLGMYCGPGYVHVLLSPHYWVCTVGLGMYMSCCPLTIGYVLWAWVCTCLVVPSLLGMYCGPGYVHVVPSLLGMYCGPGYVHVLSPHYWVCTVGLGMYMLSPHYWVCTAGRTFPSQPYFAGHLQEAGQSDLHHVLHGYAVADPETGYCQGLSFVTGLILMHVRHYITLASQVRLVFATDQR